MYYLRKGDMTVLRFITGGVNSSKSDMLTRAVIKSVENGKDVLVIVPDQYSFEYDKELYSEIGASAFNSIEVIAFNRLCEKIIKLHGNKSGDFADSNARLICMYQALCNVKKADGLLYFKKAAGKPGFCTQLLETVDEMRNSGIDPSTLSVAGADEDGLLSDKISDISRICDEYAKALEIKGLKDNSTLVSEAVKSARESGFFRGKTVYIHEFSDFSYDEYELISAILSSAEKTVVSLILTDEKNARSTTSPYKTTVKTRSRLTSIAKSMGIPVEEEKSTEYCFDSKALKYLSQNAFLTDAPVFNGENDGVEVVCASSPYEEAEYVAAKILTFVKNGMRFKDIAVFTRNISEYYPVLESAFERYEIPMFADIRQSVFTSPLAVYVMNIFDCVLTRELKTENVLRYIKSPLSSIGINDASALEEYALKWGVDKKLWESDFTGKTSETDEELSKINQTRKKAVEPLLKFKNSSQGKTADEICLLFNELLNEVNLSEKTFSVIAKSSESSDREMLEQARCFKQIWKSFLAAINSIYITMNGEKLTLKSFAELVRVILSQSAISTPPQSLDAVTVAKAEHSRISGARVCFVVGLNDGLFPSAVRKTALITEREKQRLKKHGVEFSNTGNAAFDNERLITATALFTGKEFLCASFPIADAEGAPLRESTVVSGIKHMFPGCVKNASDMPLSFYCQSENSAYFKYFDYVTKDPQKAKSVRNALADKDGYKDKFEYFDTLCEQKDHRLSKGSSRDLFFSRDLNLSATRVEDYYKCPFNYFCKNGLKIYPVRKMEISPAARGSLIHFCLEELMCERRDGRVCYRKSFEDMTDSEIRSKVHILCREYSDRELGGDFAKTKRYYASLKRLEQTVFYAVKNIAEELKGSLFKPCAFEYDLTRENGESLLKIKVRDGIYINIRGQIDRVDVYDNAGIRYIRITDYKTGGKKLSLSDLYHGLNMQMLIYLLAVISSDNDITHGANVAPAGILYMPAKYVQNCIDRTDFTKQMRDDMEKTLKLFRDEQFKREGLLVDNEISLRAMDETFSGLYAPVKLKKDGSYKKADLMPMDRLLFSELQKFVKERIENLGEKLLDGRIEAKPILRSGELSCRWCDYWSVCGNYADKDPRTVTADDQQKLLDRLNQAADKGGDGNA